jgi:hypothetical protein
MIVACVTATQLHPSGSRFQSYMSVKSAGIDSHPVIHYAVYEVASL